MTEAYVVDAVRTAVGKRNGSLAGVHPIDLGVAAFHGLFERIDVNPAAVDDVVVGCVDAIGGQAGNIGRNAWLAAGYPEEIPGVTVDRQCGSSLQAISFGAQAIMANTAGLILAGGMQNMSQIPIASAMVVGKEFGFTNEIIAVDGFRIDEGPRETSLEKMATLKTLSECGRPTAAVASQISDGASAVLLASEQAVADHKLTPRARIHHISARGADPMFMLTGPIPVTRYALEKTGLSIDDIDTVEINEAFAPVVLAWLKEIKVDPEKVNPNGGAIALGHPLG